MVNFKHLGGIKGVRSLANVLTAPQAFLPEVAASDGGTVTLHCLFHGNPPPKITWRFRAQTIESNTSRHSLTPDGSLVINPLHSSDSGVYFCLAENSLGLAMQQVQLVVNDPSQARYCPEFREEYDRAVDCPYGVYNWTLNGCYRWKCKEDPCVRVNCSSSEHCVRNERIRQNSQGDWYSARCVPGPDCEPFRKECNRLQDCEHGIEKLNGTNGCEKCKCKQKLCKEISCAKGKRCVLQKSMNQLNDQDPLFSAECYTMVKAGACPEEKTRPLNDTCPSECTDDADCQGVGKCCRRGCSLLCLAPVALTIIECLPALAFLIGKIDDKGFENESCPVPCNTTLHGCCQDGNTPAHGPDFEGCCLLQAFKCCPDNRKPAIGPHHEGCNCQNTLHGCCPDNVRIAQGPDNQGCGCRYTQHGCCPDRHTAAVGPNYEGCACNTYQFGCCADGVTTVTRPEQYGCHCSQSTFGCCGDGETPANGPDSAGCDCSSSRHGCCPDGRTEATGAKFLGCIDAHEYNVQSACSMPLKLGPCENYTEKYYYDLEDDQCKMFWYGGCDGNDNRFETREECENVCSHLSTKDLCSLLIDPGSCAGNYSRWGFNSKTYRCEQFVWGGCEGNSNRFSTEAGCQMRCAGKQPNPCIQPQEAGNCTKKEALWSFSQSENRCLPFYYSGCGGNDNRFGSREDCEQTCPSAYVPDKCTLPYKTGQRSDLSAVRWFYDTSHKRCRQFHYKGSGGNENNFATEAVCLNSCAEIKNTITSVKPVEPQPPTQRPDEPKPKPPAQETDPFSADATFRSAGS